MNDSGQDHIQSTDGCEVVYIASQFGRQKEMRLFRDKLEQIPGVKVNARWLDEEPLGREPTDRELVCMSSRDLNDVKMAATFILVNPPPYVGGRKELARGGRVYEAGVAGAIQMFVRDIVCTLWGTSFLNNGRGFCIYYSPQFGVCWSIQDNFPGTICPGWFC